MFTLIIYIITAAIGFIMAYLYKKSVTGSQFLHPEPKRALRWYLTVFVLAILTTFALSFFTARALVSSPIPEENNMQYINLKSVMVFSINISFFLLVLLANLYSQALRKIAIAPYLFAISFYVLFILKDAYFISDYYVLWQKSMQLIHGDIPDFTQTAWTKCLLALGVTAFNAIAIWWGLRK